MFWKDTKHSKKLIQKESPGTLALISVLDLKVIIFGTDFEMKKSSGKAKSMWNKISGIGPNAIQNSQVLG